MKKLNIFFKLLALLFVVGACEEQDNIEPIGNWELSAPVLAGPAENATVTLDQSAPNAATRFEWSPAVSSKNYGVTYKFVIDSAANADFSTPILSMATGNGGKNTFIEPTAAQIDQALSLAGYDANTTVSLKWGVVAQSLSKEMISTGKLLSLKRFQNETTTLYISGSATEKGTDVNQAIMMRPRKDSNGKLTNVFEAYTRFTDGGTFQFYSQPNANSIVFGGAGNGTLRKKGTPIAAPGAGTYRVTVNLSNNTYSFTKIDKWAVIGGAFAAGWSGEEPLEYKGNGIWSATLSIEKAEDFIFRANSGWDMVMKRVKGTTNQLVQESQAAAEGKEFENIPVTATGKHVVTLNLSGDQYTYSLVKTNRPASMPDNLFLLQGNTVVAEFSADGGVFKSNVFLALESGKTYTLNSKRDGSGTAFTTSAKIGETTSPNADAVTATVNFATGNGAIAVSRDQAYQINLDFDTNKLTWKYYNMKLFHWSNWDTRDEFVMTYKHPYIFEGTHALQANYEMKFNSPWDVEFGTNSTALSGTMTHKGANYKGITQAGTYKATITVANDYKTAEYSFVKQ
ncbi:SusE domain-containing protein [Rufibacter sediminis]|uniref:SusE domain-containing protein n=1 Tax=Rufibacter sediminis TaxID=2762756 RepID=A0ABR6VV09_9BACT|nr:SusE domain-containing protein [Rufibacter sediminis]MBC3540765.1 SusE domain-containing protein [Rufibacter sediminis]